MTINTDPRFRHTDRPIANTFGWGGLLLVAASLGLLLWGLYGGMMSSI